METPRRWKALCWIGVGLAVMVKGSSGVRAVTTVLRVRVMSSAIRVWKLWTGNPSSVRPLFRLLTAEGVVRYSFIVSDLHRLSLPVSRRTVTKSNYGPGQ